MSKQFVFGASPQVRMRRSKFDLSHGVKTTMNVGTLYPISVTEVVPGDTFRFKATQVVRLSSAFLRPVMDNCFMDVYYFYVPNRIVYDKFKETMGENTKGPWANLNPPEVPTTTTAGTVISGSVADYLGLPVGKVPAGINVLPFRAFAMIYNEWFRNENVIDPMYVQKGDIAVSESFNGAAWAPNNYFGMPPKVGKRKDYFTSALPAPQKGPSVSLPINGTAPVMGSIVAPSISVRNASDVGNANVQGFTPEWYQGMQSPNKFGPGYISTDVVGQTSVVDNSFSQVQNEAFLRLATDRNVFLFGQPDSNAFADLSQATAADVNDWRFAFQLQKMYEKDARYGTRYREYLAGHFGVTTPDATVQVPEFLGGARMPINVQQVAQTNTQTKTSEGGIESPLASLGAMSQSVGKSRFTKSFTEPGFVFMVACIRQMHTYQQGINKMWTRKERNDYYDPLFANIGEQPIYSSELFTDGNSDLKANVFGYNEAWADLRYKPSIVTGEMRSNISNSLDIWHFADDYTNAPVLSKEFIEETPTFFDRTVAVPSQSQDNFIVDFWVNVDAYRVMPVYSVPGLIDHH